MSSSKNVENFDLNVESKASIKYAKQQKLFNAQMEYNNYLRKNLYAAKLLYKNGISICDINQANKDFRKLLKLDEITEINGRYKQFEYTKFKEYNVQITKENFYNAFFTSIWHNLTLPERIKILEWMFETINEKYNLNIKHITYIPDYVSGMDTQLILGWYYAKYNEFFLNINSLKCATQYSYIVAVAHELMHARQRKYIKHINSQNGNKQFGDYENFLFHESKNGSYYFNNKIEKKLRLALYRTCQAERDATLQGLKYALKYEELNRKKFGFDRCSAYLLELADIILFSERSGIVYKEQVDLKGHSKTLLKLSSIMEISKDRIEFYAEGEKKYRQQKDEIIKSFIDSSFDFHEQIEEYTEMIAFFTNNRKMNEAKYKLAKSYFTEILETGMLPDNFSEDFLKEFGYKNDIKQPTLPKWLHSNKLVDIEDGMEHLEKLLNHEINNY